MTEKERLSKVLSRAGVASRRACEALIAEGRITVNGKVETVPQTKVSLKEDKILVDGGAVTRAEPLVYYVVNKPKGFLCSSKEAPRIRRVIDLFPPEHRLFTVGRLDKETTGLLLVTNDGHFANSVIHPSSDVQKEYLAKVDQDITDFHLRKVAQGGVIEETFVKPVRVTKVRRGTVRVVVNEGKKREVRILLMRAGLRVRELNRIRIGSLQLGALPVGHFRELTERDKKALFSQG